jgi:hypothetical protein
VQAAASFIRDHAPSFPGGRVPTDPSQLVILAIKSYEVFLNLGRATPGPAGGRSDVDIANAIVEMCNQFDRRIAGYD